MMDMCKHGVVIKRTEEERGTCLNIKNVKRDSCKECEESYRITICTIGQCRTVSPKRKKNPY